MSDSAPALATYVEELRRITREVSDEKQIVEAVVPHAQALAATAGLLKDEHYQCNEEQGFAVHLLHEEEDHSLAVFVLAWLPGRGTPVHNHKTWGVVVGIEGEETDTGWRRIDDGSRTGYAELVREETITIGPGHTSSVLSEDIHCVRNNSSQTSLSLHTYGTHINFTGRSEFDIEAKTESKFEVIVD